MLGDRFGPRAVLAIAAMLWAGFTALTGMIRMLGGLIAVRFLLGLAQGPVFPASTRAVTNWFPPAERARGNALSLAGISIGSLLMPPIVSWMVSNLSWQRSFYVTAAFSLAFAAIWWIYVRDSPSEHPDVSTDEHSQLKTSSEPPGSGSFEAIRDGNMWRMVASYTLHGYVGYVFIFWSFLYLVQERKLGQAEGAWLTSAAWGLAAVTTLAGGWLSDRLTRSRLGEDWGRRLVPMVCQSSGAVLLIIAARVPGNYLAAGLFGLCTGLVLAVEGAYWASANRISADRNAGFVGGMLNTGGNFGGSISPLLTPLIAQQFGWVRALDVAALVNICAALLWLTVAPSRRSAQLKRAACATNSLPSCTEPRP
jgi:ACS family glucarate transporter-like MFS transporter